MVPSELDSHQRRLCWNIVSAVFLGGSRENHHFLYLTEIQNPTSTILF